MTGEAEKLVPTKAQDMGPGGGSKGGKIRAAKLTPEQRSEIAKKAAQSLQDVEFGEMQYGPYEHGHINVKPVQ